MPDNLPPPADGAPPHDEDTSFHDILGVAARRWMAIAAIILIATLAALLAVLRAHPGFTISGALYLGDTQSNTTPAASDGSGLGFLSAYRTVSDVDTEVGLLGARALIERAVLETGLNATITPQAAPHPPFWIWKLFDHASVDVYRPPRGSLRALAAGFADPGLRQASYRVRFGAAGAYTVSDSPGWLPGAATRLTGRLGQPAAGGGLGLVIQPVYPGYIPPPGSRFTLTILPAGRLADEIAGQLTVAAGGTLTQPTSLAAVTLTWGDPYQGVAFVNQLMRDFIATELGWKTAAASATQGFIAGQLAQVKASLAAADQKLAAYQAATGLLDVPENAKSAIDQLAQYQAQRAALRLRQQALRQIAAQLASRRGPLDPFILSQTNDPVLGQLCGELADAEAKLQTLGVQFTGASPEVQVQQAQLAALQHAITSLVGNDLALAGAGLDAADRMIGQFNGRLQSMPAQSLKVIALTRDSEVFGKLYAFLVQQEEEAAVLKAASVIDTRIVSPAELPLDASRPKAAVTLLFGLAAGLFASLALVLSQWSFSPRFEGEDDIGRAAGPPVFAVIPGGAGTAGLVPSRPHDGQAEGFRLLRSRLYGALAQSANVVMLTSAGVTDGRGFVALNLARAFAETGKRVLLAETDPQSGRLAALLGSQNAPGLADWLRTGAAPTLDPVTGRKFAFLPAGAPSPDGPDALDPARLGELLAALRRRFDIILLDTAPLPAVADSLIIAPLADLLLSVAAVGGTQRRAWRRHHELLRPLGRRQAIVIIGGVRPRPFARRPWAR